MAVSDEAVREAVQSFYDAVNRVMHGDAGAMLALWSARDDVTCFDPRGGVHRGRRAISAYWERAAEANRATPGAIVATGALVHAHASDRLICALTVEQVEITRDGRASRHEARATLLYRREEDDRWRMVHRHSEPTREVGSPPGTPGT